MRVLSIGIIGVCLLFGNMMGPYYRDLILFSLVESTTKPHILEDCHRIYDPTVPHVHFPNKKETLELFSMEEKAVPFTYKNKDLIAKVLIFRSKGEGKAHSALRIGGSDEVIACSAVRIMPYLTSFTDLEEKGNLNFIQMSYHDIFDGKRQWKPSKISDVGGASFSLMQALKEQGIVDGIDSLICHSMGGVSLDYLHEIKDPSLVPKTIILDRAIPSTWKVALSCYNLPIAAVMNGGAKLLGWNADCEQALLAFFKNCRDVEGRRVIFIETEEDYYFSNQSAFDANLGKKLNDLGVESFQHRFFVNRVWCHERAHHALPIHYLINSSEKPLGEGKFTVEPHESVAHAIARSVFAS